MKTSKKGVELIKQFEGYRANAYKCAAGVWTIGYGHTKGVRKGDKVTREEATELLRADLKHFEEGVARVVQVPLKQCQFDALVSFSFNVGLGALSRSTLLRLLNDGEYVTASLEFLKWKKAGGRTLLGLLNRRKKERALFLGLDSSK